MKSINRDYAYCIIFTTLLLLPQSCIQILYSEYYFTYVTNKQMCIDKMFFIVYYYSPTRFGRFCDRRKGVIYKNTNNCTTYLFKPP